MVEESWPKLFQPDYTEVVTKVLNAKADAMYSALWGGDLSAFIDQGNLYGLFDKQASFMVNLGDYGVVDEVKQFPRGRLLGRPLQPHGAADQGERGLVPELRQDLEAQADQLVVGERDGRPPGPGRGARRRPTATPTARSWRRRSRA